MTLTQAKESIGLVGREGLETLIEEIGMDTISQVLEQGADAEQLKDLVESLSADIVKAGIDGGIDLDNIEEAYQGQYDSDREFAMDMANQLGQLDNNVTWPNNCIDWDFAAKELMYDYCSSNGYYFRNL